MIQFFCPNCKLPMHTESIASGFFFPCPQCNTTVKIPILTQFLSSTHIPSQSIIGCEVTQKETYRDIGIDGKRKHPGENYQQQRYHQCFTKKIPSPSCTST